MYIDNKLVYLVTSVLLIFLVAGCSNVYANPQITQITWTNDTNLGASRLFVEALIKGDKVTLNILNKSDDWSTDRLVQELTPDFRKYSSNDISISVSPDFPAGNVIFVKTSDNKIKTALVLEQFNRKFYFVDIMTNPMMLGQ